MKTRELLAHRPERSCGQVGAPLSQSDGLARQSYRGTSACGICTDPVSSHRRAPRCSRQLVDAFQFSLLG
ncbi:hypothetical protein J1614_001238 [Plenodomus biglobosus]|nr:hypothetical protein J1614_001238 [Plenodomus biglobosus]